MERIERYEVGDTDINGNKVVYVYSYKNGDWEWEDEEGNEHLVRDGVELTKGKNAKGVISYDSGDWKWKDEEGYWHLVRGVVVEKGILKIERYEVGDNDVNGNKVKHVDSYENGDWEWRDEEGNEHLVRDGVELTVGKKAKDVHSYANGAWEWEDEEGNKHVVKSEDVGVEKDIDIKIDREGDLYIYRKGSGLKAQRCMYNDRYCGDWCPKFSEPIIEGIMDNDIYDDNMDICLCDGVKLSVLKNNFVDER
jgi:hypothetical protein